MYIGSLFHDQTPVAVTYTYCQRGTNVFYPPDQIKETEKRIEFNKENGNLFYGSPVSWKAPVLLQEGIDIKISYERCCFIDHVILSLGKGAELESAEVFVLKDACKEKAGLYASETGHVIDGAEMMIPVGAYAEQVILRLNGCCKPVEIEKLELFGAVDLNEAVWPIPVHMENGKSWIPVAQMKGVKAKTEDEVFAAAHLSEKWKEKTGILLNCTGSEGELEFCLLQDARGEHKEGEYTLQIGPEGGKIEAYDRRGLLYGAETLLQKVQGEKVACCQIKDAPFMEFRGVHLALPPKNQLSFLKNLVKYVFVPMHYNALILQIAGAMRYDKFPEINAGWINACEKYEAGDWPLPAHYGFVSRDIWEKDEVRALCEYLEAYGLEVIPEIQSFSHSQYITAAFPDLAEKVPVAASDTGIDLNEEDEMPDEFYPSCLCPSHPEYDRIVLGILDEVLETVRPKRYVHMGHDEIIIMGKCPICAAKAKSDVFAEEVTKLNAYIKQKNLTMMIWSDMVQQQRYAVPKAIGKIPKDVIMMDFVWYFHLEEDLEERLLSHGFKVIMGNMYSSHYPRFSKRAHTEGMIGAEVSTWVPCNEVSYAYEGKMFDFVYSANSMWSSEYCESMRLSYYEIIKPLLADIRKKIGGIESSKEERRISLPGKRENVPYDIRERIPYSQAVRVGADYQEATLEVDEYVELLTVVHATDMGCRRIMWKPPVKIGGYVLAYEDGSEWQEPILYASNIYKYQSPFGDRDLSPLFRHEGYFGTYLAIPECGKTYEGKDYTLGRYSFKNPYPEKKIKEMKILHTGDVGANILVFDVILQ